MILDYIIILPASKKQEIKEGLLVFQNIYALIICCQSLYSIYDWRNTGNVDSLNNTTTYLRFFLLFLPEIWQ